ncbi:MAG: hypothetical protein O6826_03220, partial [Acidobacteria bacterium]|nr:hypothetical protein [Acidobacteriota bacterium]
MKRKARAAGSFLLLLLFLFPLDVFGERKHGNVEEIGNREINGRVAWIFPNFVSLEKEIQLGAQLSMEMDRTARFVEDPVVVEYIEQLAQKIVKHSDAK